MNSRPLRRLTAAGCALIAAAGLMLASGAAADAAQSTTLPTPVAATDFTSTVALSDCSGSVVRWTTSKPTDTALMLTNGHCYGSSFLGAHQVVVDKPAVRDVELLAADGSDLANIQTVKILYATMDKTDVALYSLGLTYQQLQNQYGVPALTIASSRATPKDEPISVISGFWKIQYDCHLNGFVYRLHEDVWTWRESLRYADNDGCDTIGGTSGSPVVDASRTMIGINNTGNDDGERCTLDNPCEENRAGKITVHQGRDYGEETWGFYTCLTANRTIDLHKSGCLLAKP
jgi:V8-like Glu-specific endopeptidase